MKLLLTILTAAVLVLAVVAIMQHRAMVNMDAEMHNHLSLLSAGHLYQHHQIDSLRAK
jgi:cell division protein FtsL